MNNSPLILVQPGAFGDIFVCAPIADYFTLKGYNVLWPARHKYISTIDKLHLVSPIEIPDTNYHEDWMRSDVLYIYNTLIPQLTRNCDTPINVLNLADRGPHPTAQRADENFEECKYRISELPMDQVKHSLKFKISSSMDDLYKLKISDFGLYPKEYNLVHLTDSYGNRTSLPAGIKGPIIEVTEVPGYSIFDWYLIAYHANNIYCIESAFHQFIDGISKELLSRKVGLYLLRRHGILPGYRYTVSKNWNKTYIGETIVRS